MKCIHIFYENVSFKSQTSQENNGGNLNQPGDKTQKLNTEKGGKKIYLGGGRLAVEGGCAGGLWKVDFAGGRQVGCAGDLWKVDCAGGLCR